MLVMTPSSSYVNYGRQSQFPGSSVYLQLDGMGEFIRKFPEIRPFRDVLPDQFVHVFYRAFLSGGIAVREVYRGIERFRDLLVRAELEAVVHGYRQYILPVESSFGSAFQIQPVFYIIGVPAFAVARNHFSDESG